jgi:hypothetical protein
MTPEARALARALLDHRKRLRSTSGEQTSLDSALITYGELCARAGLPHIKAVIGKFLREVAQWCDRNGWPPLNSLAVNHETRKPGSGYENAPGCSVEHWSDQAIACINFSGYPDQLA